jgi:hypothetical protein
MYAAHRNLKASTRRSRSLATAIVASVAALAVAGCSARGGAQTSSGHRTAVIPRPVTLNLSANGETVHVRPGTSLTINFDGGGWTVSSHGSGLVQRSGLRTASKVSPCYPGMWCGNEAADFLVTDVGATVVTASRSVCGEDVICPPTDSQFEVTILSGR